MSALGAGRGLCLAQSAELRVKKPTFLRLMAHPKGPDSSTNRKQSAVQKAAVAVQTRTPFVIILKHLSDLDTRDA